MTKHISDYPILLTISQVADIAQVSDKTIRRLIKNRNLKAHKIGAVWRIHPDDLGAYISATKRR